MAPMDLYSTTIDIVADLIVRRAGGPARPSDAAAAELRRIVTDRLRASDRGASTLPGLDRLPMDPHARHAAAAALAADGAADPSLPAQLQPHVNAVFWMWQQEAQGAARSARKRRSRVIAATAVAALLLGGGAAATTYFLTRPTLREVALGTWTCEETKGDNSYAYTIAVADGTYELRLLDPDSEAPALKGTWSEKDGVLTLSGKEDDDSFTVREVPGLANEKADLGIVKSGESTRHTVTATPTERGIEVNFRTDDNISIKCVKTAD